MGVRIRGGVIAASILIGLCVSAVGVGASVFPHIDTWMIFYHSGLPESEVQFVAEHMDLLDGGRTYLPLLRAFGSEAPVVRYLQFHNGQDDAELHDSLYAFCVREGIEVEEMFLHFYQDTECWPRYEGSPGTVLGWGGGSAPAESLARVPVDWWNSYMYDIGEPDFRRFFAWFCRKWLQISHDGYFIDGFMYDNTMTRLTNTIEYLHAYGYPQPSNWEINEYPSAPNRDSVWVNDLILLLDEVRDSLEQATAEPHLMVNLIGSSSSSWQPYGWYWGNRVAEHVDSGILEYFVQWNEWFGQAFFDRVDSLSATGMSVLIHAAGAPPGHEWCERSRLYTLALYYILAEPRCHWGYTSSGYGATPSEYNWFPAIELDIGTVLGPRTVLSQGTNWTIWGRQYEWGGAVVRTRTSGGSFDDPEVVQPLTSVYRPISSEGVIGENVSEISLRNNEGAILVMRPQPELLAPNGGEELVPYEESDIQWSRRHPTTRDSLLIELSLDGGATYPDEIARVPLIDTLYTWVVPDTSTAAARVRVTAYDDEGSYFVDASQADFAITTEPGVEDSLDGFLGLSRPLPHPVRDGCTFSLTLPAAGRARVTLYNCLGSRVREVFSGRCEAGRTDVAWDSKDDGGRPVASGVYLCRLEARGDARVQKVVVAR